MRRFAALLATFFPILAMAAYTGSSSESFSEGAAPDGAGHFGAQLVLTPDENQFIRAWSESPRSSDLPATASVRLGASVTALLVFQGCTPDFSGKCDVVADFSLIAPNGSLIPGGTGALWAAKPLPGRLHLGNASMGLRFDPADPVGPYKVVATVKDNVSGRTVSLSSVLIVQE